LLGPNFFLERRRIFGRKGRQRHSLLSLSFKARLGLEISAFESSKGQRKTEEKGKKKCDVNETDRRTKCNESECTIKEKL